MRAMTVAAPNLIQLSAAGRRRLAAIRFAVGALTLLICLLVVYRVQLGTGGRWLGGGELDQRIAVALQEHWFDVLRGRTGWRTPLFFYPTPDGLGFNDGYFLFGLVFSIFRVLGIDMFLAAELVGAACRVCGFAAIYLFGRTALALSPPFALLAAALGVLSNCIYLQSWHIQLLTVYFAPVLGLIIGSSLVRLRQRRFGAAIALSCAGALLLDAWLMTAFYMAWFTILFVLTVAAAACVLAPRAAVAFARSLDPRPLLPAIAVFACGIVPFALVYVPTARMTGMHPFAEALSYTPSILDLLHVGSGNLLFGSVDRLLAATLRPGFPDFGEHTVGLPPALWLLAGLSCAFSLRGTVRREAFGLLPAALSLAFLITLLLIARVGSVSLWRVAFSAIPGAAAVRVVARDMLLLDLVAVLLAARLLQSIRLQSIGSRVAAPLLLTVVAVLIVEEINGKADISLEGVIDLRRAEPLASS